tara:strand:+ start:362 stop:793 length:432 start_codon:yes stop_codon:yes gene_type:complete
VAFLFYLSTQISTNIPDYGVFFDTGKLSDSGTEKRLRNGPFAENARWQGLARVLHALERSAPDNLPGVACGVLKPSAEQQGVQEERQDGVLGGPRCRKESRQPTHAAWSSASAACIIHQLHVESPGFSQNVTILTGGSYYSTS